MTLRLRGRWMVAVAMATTGAMVQAQGGTPSSGLINRSGIVYGSRSDKVYVADSEHGAVAILSANGHAKLVKTGAAPISIAVNERTGRVYVANSGDRSVAVLDGDSDRLVASVATAARPYAIAVDEVTDKVYVSNTFSDMLTVIDGKTNSVMNVKTGSADAIVVDAQRGNVYLLGYESDTLKVLNEKTQTVSSVSSGTMHQWGLVELGKTLYVSHVQDADVEAIDVETHGMRRIATGAMPCALAVDGERGELYAVNYADASVSVINAERETLVATVKVGGHPQGIAIDSARHVAYVADAQGGFVSVIDIGRRSVREKLDTGGRPYAVAVSARTHRVFAATMGATPYVEIKAP